MAEISQNYNVLQPFPDIIGEYKVKFTPEEQATIDKWTDFDFIKENSLMTDGGHGGAFVAEPYSTPEARRQSEIWNDDFLIVFVGMNLLKHPEWQSIGQTVSELAHHYASNIIGMQVPKETDIGVSDSWMIRNKCTDAYPQPFHRRHNHSFAWLTGVLYLDDSPNGTILHKPQPFGDEFLPFLWTLDNNQYNKDVLEVPAEKGKCIIFPSNMDHSIMNNADGTIRHTIAFNIFPYGKVSKQNAALLEYSEIV